MRKAIEVAASLLAILALLDMLVLFASMGQIAQEGRTGSWSPFWRAQAEFVARHMR